MFKQRAVDHLNGGCRLCGIIASEVTYKGSKDFIEESKTFPSGVYLLKFKDFYKIGISKNIDRRINLIKSRLSLDYTPEIIFYKKVSLFDAINVENSLHEKYINNRFTYKTFFEGHTECFTTDLPIQEVIDYCEVL